MPNPRIKICCISSVEEAMLAINHGATAIGLVGPMPSGPGPIPNKRITEIAQAVPEHIETFMLTSETTLDGVLRHHELTRTNTIQLVDALEAGAHADLKAELPDVQIIQVIHVHDEWAMDAAMEVVHQVDALLLDSGNPKLKVKQLGGTGRTHDWEISRKIVEMAPVPVYLAGGLHPNNVADAIRKVKPYGVDICSGVRTNGQLDRFKLEQFVAAVRYETAQLP
ncbi:MAG: phosphoribosylanthranilate isomerase [Bacteroidota bacterium]